MEKIAPVLKRSQGALLRADLTPAHSRRLGEHHVAPVPIQAFPVALALSEATGPQCRSETMNADRRLAVLGAPFGIRVQKIACGEVPVALDRDARSDKLHDVFIFIPKRTTSDVALTGAVALNDC